MSFDAPSWLVTWLDSVSIWDAVLWLIAVVGLVVFIRKKGWRWIIAFARAILATADVIDRLADLPQFMAKTDAMLQKQNDLIESIHHETHTNNGSSIKDGVQRLELSVEGLHGRLDQVERQVGATAVPDVEIRAAVEITHGSSE